MKCCQVEKEVHKNNPFKNGSTILFIHVHVFTRNILYETVKLETHLSDIILELKKSVGPTDFPRNLKRNI